MLDPNLSEIDYLDVLLRFQVGFRELNTYLWSALEGSEKFCQYTNQSCRLDALREDVVSISGNHRLPDYGRFPEPPSYPQGVAVLYVVMGSSLGGQVIHRVLARKESKNIRCAGRFFSGWPAERACLWKRFLADLEASAVLSHQDAKVALGANRAFDDLSHFFERFFGKWLRKLGLTCFVSH
ncbi:biliverdin-producing heme oxygenase [Marinobacter sediminum]|uniref:biliverdin-producing heme oxygenase n=1 Tax=Marinobacter sediminum TaxID=256323 RepID=UPI00193A08F9|nr:biliverdin-producing heme oxygenase [Marinobacter sediminum]